MRATKTPTTNNHEKNREWRRITFRWITNYRSAGRRKFEGRCKFGRSADCKATIQQVKNLRYAVPCLRCAVLVAGVFHVSLLRTAVFRFAGGRRRESGHAEKTIRHTATRATSGAPETRRRFSARWHLLSVRAARFHRPRWRHERRAGGFPKLSGREAGHQRRRQARKTGLAAFHERDFSGESSRGFADRGNIC